MPPLIVIIRGRFALLLQDGKQDENARKDALVFSDTSIEQIWLKRRMRISYCAVISYGDCSE